MINWHSVPMARLLIPLTFGFVVGYYAQESWPAFLIIGGLAFLTACLSAFTKKLTIRAFWQSLCCQLVLVLAAALLIQSKQSHHVFNHYEKAKAQSYWIIETREWVKVKNEQQVLVAEVKAVWQNKQWKKFSGKIRIKCPLKLRTISADGAWYMIEANGIHPSQKNKLKQWMKQNNLAEILQIKAISPLNQCALHLNLAHRLSHWLLSALNPFFNKEMQGMVAAILIGNKDKVANSTIKLMQTTGTLHVLAVSGMHAAILFSLLSFSLKRLKQHRIGTVIYYCTCFFVLWLYCFMTGASASVMRATIMCSLVIMAEILKRKGQAINTLLATAVIILIANPFTLFEIGFQLSFTAVLGILLVYPKLQTLYSHHQGIKKWFFDSINMSLSAQLLSSEIAWFYFLQYPIYSLIANLIIVPIYSVILIALLISIPLLLTKPILVMLAKAITITIQIGNTIMNGISQWPFAVYVFHSSTILELCLLYSIVIIFLIGMNQKKIPLIQISCVLLIGILTWKQILEHFFNA
jgi:competence protein ComEC